MHWRAPEYNNQGQMKEDIHIGSILWMVMINNELKLFLGNTERYAIKPIVLLPILEYFLITRRTNPEQNIIKQKAEESKFEMKTFRSRSLLS